MDEVSVASPSLAARLRSGRGIAHKSDIAPILARLRPGDRSHAAAGDPGDDCAVLEDQAGFLLFAIEGFIPEFVRSEPWFAGYCGVMVNLSDVAAMGGRPVAVVDALWSDGLAQAEAIADGLAFASRTYAVPVVGGHTNTRAPGGAQLSVAVLGRATRLIRGDAARPGHVLVAAIDLRGRMRAPSPWWDASSGAARDGLGERLRRDLALLPELAEDGLVSAGKDISMGGVIGTALMLAEASGIGLTIDPELVPRPAGVELEAWLGAFPSFGFLIAVREAAVPAVLSRFGERGIAAAAVGRCCEGSEVRLAGETEPVWDFARAGLVGARGAARVAAREAEPCGSG